MQVERVGYEEGLGNLSKKHVCLTMYHDTTSWTALMYATLAGPSSTLCQLLVSHGADVNVKNWLGVTAVHIARQQGHRALSDYLDSLSEERHRRGIVVSVL